MNDFVIITSFISKEVYRGSLVTKNDLLVLSAQGKDPVIRSIALRTRHDLPLDPALRRLPRLNYHLHSQHENLAVLVTMATVHKSNRSKEGFGHLSTKMRLTECSLNSTRNHEQSVSIAFDRGRLHPAYLFAQFAELGNKEDAGINPYVSHTVQLWRMIPVFD